MTDNLPSFRAPSRELLLRSRGLRGLSEDEREEIVDKVIERILSEPSLFSMEELTKIAMVRIRQRAIDLIRHKRRERKALVELGTRLQRYTSDHKDDHVSKAIAKEFRAALFKELIEALSSTERKAIYGRFYRGDTLDEVAAGLGVAVSTAHFIIRVALSKLQRRLSAFRGIAPSAMRLLEPEDPDDPNTP